MSLARVLVCSAALAACGSKRPAVPVPDIPVIAASLETQRLSTLYCAPRGFFIAPSPDHAAIVAGGSNANLVVAFTYTSSKSTQNGITRITGTELTAKAVHCPDDILREILLGTEVAP